MPLAAEAVPHEQWRKLRNSRDPIEIAASFGDPHASLLALVIVPLVLKAGAGMQVLTLQGLKTQPDGDAIDLAWVKPVPSTTQSGAEVAFGPYPWVDDATHVQFLRLEYTVSDLFRRRLATATFNRLLSWTDGTAPPAGRIELLDGTGQVETDANLTDSELSVLASDMQAAIAEQLGKSLPGAGDHSVLSRT